MSFLSKTMTSALFCSRKHAPPPKKKTPKHRIFVACFGDLTKSEVPKELMTATSPISSDSWEGSISVSYSFSDLVSKLNPFHVLC